MISALCAQFSRRCSLNFYRQIHGAVKCKEEFKAACLAAGVEPKVGFIGGGNMARALIKGFLDNQLITPDRMAVSDPDPNAQKVAQSLGLSSTTCNKKLLDICQNGVIILAVKPQSLVDILHGISNELPAKAGLIGSVIAGASSQYISQGLNQPVNKLVPIIRIMPNTPALIGCGTSVYSRSKSSTKEHARIISMMLQTVGSCYEISENHMDACTGLSASGPGFIYTLVEALSDGGVKMGLSRDMATQLAASTMMGSAKMVLDTKQHTGQLKDMVCSPGGTTIHGVHALEAGNVRAALIAAVEAATQRAKELSKCMTESATRPEPQESTHQNGLDVLKPTVMSRAG